jgi:hypothetical protein
MRDVAEDADETRSEQGPVESNFAEPALWNRLPPVTGLLAWGALG